MISPSGRVRTADLLGALSLAADLAVGLPAEHGMRACYMGMRIASELDLSPVEQADLYYAELLMDAGCTAFTSQLAAYILGEEISARRDLFFHTDVDNPLSVISWLTRYMAAGRPLNVRASRSLDFVMHGRDRMREGFRETCDAAQRLAARLGMPASVQAALVSVFEQWDGSGMPNGLKGADIPVIARVVYATSFLEVFHRVGGPEAALRIGHDRRGKSFDPAVVEAFEAASSRPDFWETLGRESVWETVLELEPSSPQRFIPADRVGDVAASLADFADLKAPHLIGHARRVAHLAGRLAERLRLPVADVARVRLAGLLHDFGLVTVPSFVLGKAEQSLTQAEREMYRLHPYYAERILGRIETFAAAITLAAAHHEAMDGSGYPRGLAGSRIPTGARIVAAADRFDELTHDGPECGGLDSKAALRKMRPLAGKILWMEAYEALCEEARGAPEARTARRQERPRGLTDREVEVLRLLARGSTRKEMARALTVTESTVRAHLEHIYTKIDVSSRAAARLFAVENDLLD